MKESVYKIRELAVQLNNSVNKTYEKYKIALYNFMSYRLDNDLKYKLEREAMNILYSENRIGGENKKFKEAYERLIENVK